jgi:membrane protein implicated in regulation of membrane protease activity
MRNPVIYKMMFGRFMSYMAYVQFMMVAYIFVSEVGIVNFWILGTVFVVLAGLLAYFDWKYVFPQEKIYDSIKNPQWNEMMDRLKTIRYDQQCIEERVSGIYTALLNIEARIPRVYGKRSVIE